MGRNSKGGGKILTFPKREKKRHQKSPLLQNKGRGKKSRWVRNGGVRPKKGPKIKVSVW